MDTNIIWGYEGENILSPLVEELGNQGIPCVEVNPCLNELKQYSYLAGRCNILTSNHYTRTREDLNELYPELRIKHDFFDAIDFFKPKKKLFFLHDHGEAFVLNEFLFGRYWDLVVTPWPSIHKTSAFSKLRAYDMLLKNESEYDNLLINSEAVWFVSNIVALTKKLGQEGFTEYILSYAKSGISVKLPVYPGMDALEHQLARMGVKVIPSLQSSAITMLQAKTVVCSGLSGICDLAFYYNKPVIVIDDLQSTGTSKRQSLVEKLEFYSNSLVVEDPRDMEHALLSLNGESNEAGLSARKPHRLGFFRDDFVTDFLTEFIN
jgi:hypothetical protein